ncbi:MAG: phosphoenolpyruvate carboxylase [Aureliella sp.]
MLTAGVLALDVDKLNCDWDWMLDALRKVLVESGDAALAGTLPEPGACPKVAADQAERVQLTQAYSIAFQLLGMAEQISAAHFRNTIEREQGVDQLPALWGDSLKQLKEAGLSDQEIADRLRSIQVELVLTAHPTEAKRATVLAHHRRLYDRFVAYDRPELAPWQKAEHREAILALLGILWTTGEIYLAKPDIRSERRNVIDYLTHVFPAALRPLDMRLRQAWEQLGMDPQLIRDPLALPRLTFGTWVGGDRDGHPLVTPQVTAETLQELRRRALNLLHQQLMELVRLISLSAYWLPPKSEFVRAIEERAEMLGPVGRRAVERNPNEPWRQFVNLILARLPHAEAVKVEASESSVTSHDEHGYKSSSQLLDDLRILYDALVAVSMAETAEFAVAPLMRIVQAFGFHLAVLDVRQNSGAHDRAIEQLLSAAGLSDSNYSQWPEKKRVEFLAEELQSRRPFALADRSAGPDADAVLGALRVVKQHLQSFGPDGLGALIVSMTRGASDLLGVYLLAREVGLLVESPEGPICPLPVVPLFETIEDLQQSPEIYDAFLSFPMTRRSLPAWQRSGSRKRPSAQVMIGYSDSNKDGGILASLVGLRNAQSRLTEVAHRHGAAIRFFHGRGGTISRGAGPTHRFIRSLPDGSLEGNLRITEQGETIAQKYAHQPSAIYNLELFLAGVTRKSLADLRQTSAPHPLEATLVELAGWAQAAYRQLLHSEGFIQFFRQATPIDAIEHSRIGSRPTRRTGQTSLNDLRAIPWVFSWGQARFYLSGWYGVGTALLTLERTDPKVFASLPGQLATWAPLHYLISNAATSIASVDMEVVHEYAALVSDAVLRTKFLKAIEAEFELTGRMLEHVYGGSLATQRPNVTRTIQLRTAGLRVLHAQQIRLLRRWRAACHTGNTAEADTLLPPLLLTVNAIASGLGTTG